jgi:hypothetical protein
MGDYMAGFQARKRGASAGGRSARGSLHGKDEAQHQAWVAKADDAHRPRP